MAAQKRNTAPLRVLEVQIANQQALIPIGQIDSIQNTDNMVVVQPLFSMAAALGWPTQAALGQHRAAAISQVNGPSWTVEAVGELRDLPTDNLHRLPRLLTVGASPALWALAEIDSEYFPVLNLAALQPPLN